MKESDINYSEENIKKIKNSKSPKILLNVCTHGDERVGLKVAAYFKKYPLQKGSLTIHVANPRAVRLKKRFVEKDLNRVFPGQLNGAYEEAIAYKMKPYIESFDLVIDIHSTKTGVESTLILNDFDQRILPIISAVSPKRALIMSATKSNSLISVSKLGVAFEYGRDESKKTYFSTIKGIERILNHFNMVSLSKKKTILKTKTDFFDAFKTVPKPEGALVSKRIKNFQLVKKGEVIGRNPQTGMEILADVDFYPILFGKNTYKDIFGFAARKID